VHGTVALAADSSRMRPGHGSVSRKPLLLTNEIYGAYDCQLPYHPEFGCRIRRYKPSITGALEIALSTGRHFYFTRAHFQRYIMV